MTSMISKRDKVNRKRYTKPNVITYGNIGQLTHASTKKGRDDGGMGKNDKTA